MQEPLSFEKIITDCREKLTKLQATLESVHQIILTISQSYYWTPEWQAKEKRADEDARAGRSKQFKSAEELIRELKS
ncbi:hypothetical protein HYS94_01720 [Candidatus Daviesbacteria bacterium]|nr:hypothetical protein [Candidatus Daviesbacteria bacterium]